MSSVRPAPSRGAAFAEEGTEGGGQGDGARVTRRGRSKASRAVGSELGVGHVGLSEGKGCGDGMGFQQLAAITDQQAGGAGHQHAADQGRLD